jgi:hypothetical protein
MTEFPEKDNGDIRVADVTLAHLARGIYRSTATALKELVSNAYDADATEVRIDTNSPEFDFLTCIDNGKGMSLESFRNYFREQGIGSCTKRHGGIDVTERFKRPIIGRLGIGMMAIGQLCHSFELESHYRDRSGNGHAYRAWIVLSDSDIPREEEIIRASTPQAENMEVGKWSYETIDFEPDRIGVRIYTDDVRNTFLREMKIGLGTRDEKRMSFRLEDLHRIFYDRTKRSIRESMPYLETIWELAILSPLPYYETNGKTPVDTSAFKKAQRDENFLQAINLIHKRQKAMLSHNFRVVFDGIELRRHVQLPTAQGKESIPHLSPIMFDRIEMGQRLKFEGYIFGQARQAITPLELNGVQIRLRNVGIGGYDRTFLKYYDQIETIRSRWVSGELFVDCGLESALNIDRDSFNEHDEHFKALQKFLHEKLHTVFNDLEAAARSATEVERDKKGVSLRTSLADIVKQTSGGNMQLLIRKCGEAAPVVSFNKNKHQIILNISARTFKSKKANTLIQAIEVAYHTALATSKDEEERHHIFFNLVKEAISHYL